MAQQQGIDYSFQHPSVSSIVAAGYTFVMRYLAYDNAFTHPKIIFGAEATALHAAGLTIGLVWESEDDPLNNQSGNTDYNMGVADATYAVGQANTLGLPADRPIFVAMDRRGQPVNITDKARYNDYYQGWTDTIGLSRVGFYGGSDLWNYLFVNGVVSGYFWQASAASWSNYKVPYPGAIMLQGLGGVLGGTSDPDTAYVNDFGQWPAPTSIAPSPGPAPHPGGTNIATVNQSASSYAQVDTQSLLTPEETHDQVIYSVTTTDATLTTGSHNGFYTIPTPINQRAYPIGTFSYDGGVTYNDFGFELPVTPSSAGVYPGVQIQPTVNSSGTIGFNGVNNTAGTVSLILNVALLASNSPSPLSQTPKLGGNLAYTNIYPKLTSDATTRVYSTYRRIASAGTVLGNSVTVAHGQSTIPNIMFWVQASGSITINPVGWRSDGTSGGALGIKMDSTNLYFHVDAGTYDNSFYRIYKDNA